MKRARSRHRDPMKAMLELSACIVKLDEEDSALRCPLCNQVFNLHQPDENLPNQLLATCDYCQRWFCLFGIGEDPNQFFMLSLPDKSVIEEARLMNGLDDQ